MVPTVEYLWTLVGIFNKFQGVITLGMPSVEEMAEWEVYCDGKTRTINLLTID